MPRIFADISQFTPAKAWQALDLAVVEGASVRIHWTDEPYVWHINDGTEVFTVLTGEVEMKYKLDGNRTHVVLKAGDSFVAEPGDEHVARPKGTARVLVVEKLGSV